MVVEYYKNGTHILCYLSLQFFLDLEDIKFQNSLSQATPEDIQVHFCNYIWLDLETCSSNY